MPNGEDDRAEVEWALRRKDAERRTDEQRGKEAAGDQAGPASNPPAEVIDERFTDMLEEMHVADDALSVKDAERFTTEQKASALNTARAYIEKHGEVDQPNPLYDIPMVEVKGDDLVVGRVTSNVGPNYGELRKGIMPDPVTGRGDARGPGYDDPSTWPLPPAMPPADAGAEERLKDAIERLGREKENRDRGFHPRPSPLKPKPELKDTNPKDAVGVRKWRVFTTVPFTIIWELGVAMMEGARKYGRHNYRVAGVRGSVYIDAAMGHLTQWWEGEDLDRDTGLSHITKAMASLCVLRDAMIQNKFVDDRPPKTNVAAVRDELQARVDDIFERIPEALPAYVEGDQNDGA